MCVRVLLIQRTSYMTRLGGHHEREQDRIHTPEGKVGPGFAAHIYGESRWSIKTRFLTLPLILDDG